MVKMSHSGRKRAVPSKVKVKDTHISDCRSSPMDEDDHGVLGGVRSARNGDGKDGTGGGSEIPAPVEWLGYHPIGLKKEVTAAPLSTTTTTGSNNNIYSNGKHDFREQSSPLLSERSAGNHETGQDETSSNGNKDDEDDDDDESEDKIDTQQHDPERLKAFNMFVRLFVDENLDRMVPISKQPKEKIQAIIDSCTRQFPEFAERARKRIRTYLKSCRRNKRSRDSTWESSRPTPAHLTSVQAEQILAQACENESQNAKRMRMGLEPVGQPLPLPANDSRSSSDNVVENGHRSSSARDRDRDSRAATNNSSSNINNNNHIGKEDNDRSTLASPEKERNSSSKSSLSSSLSSLSASSMTAAAAAAAIAAAANAAASQAPSIENLSTHNHSSNNGNLSTSSNNSVGSIGNLNGSGNEGRSPSSSIENQHPSGGVTSAPKAHDRSPLVDYSRALNGVPNMSMYRPNFGQAFQRPTPYPSIFPTTTVSTTAAATFPSLPIANGPCDLSMKSKPLLTHKLNATEIATVRQLITGYRESAAFLLRSADELEQLLIQQQ